MAKTAINRGECLNDGIITCDQKLAMPETSNNNATASDWQAVPPDWLHYSEMGLFPDIYRLDREAKWFGKSVRHADGYLVCGVRIQ